MSEVVRLERDGAAATIRFGRKHGNAINGELVEGFLAACDEIEQDGSVHAVLLASDGKLFCPGLDLQELSELDRPAMAHFLARFNDAVLGLYTLRPPVVAALHGHAVAGGCVLALTADWRVLQSEAMVGLSEVRVGVPFPFGVAMVLRESVPRYRLEEVALFGLDHRGEGARAAGLVHEVCPAAELESRCGERIEELLSRDPHAVAVTKRYLRRSTVERIRAVGRDLDDEFLDAWFRPSTQERIAALVAELRRRD
jgi:enoyl-CoA hydratase